MGWAVIDRIGLLYWFPSFPSVVGFGFFLVVIISRLGIRPVTDSSSLDSRERERASAAILRLRGRALWAEGGLK